MATKRLEQARALNKGYVYHPPQGKVVTTREEEKAYLEALDAGCSHWAAMQRAGHVPRPGELKELLARIVKDGHRQTEALNQLVDQWRGALFG